MFLATNSAELLLSSKVSPSIPKTDKSSYNRFLILARSSSCEASLLVIVSLSWVSFKACKIFLLSEILLFLIMFVNSVIVFTPEVRPLSSNDLTNVSLKSGLSMN